MAKKPHPGSTAAINARIKAEAKEAAKKAGLTETEIAPDDNAELAALVKAQAKVIADLESKIEDLKEDNDNLHADIDNIAKRLKSLETAPADSDAAKSNGAADANAAGAGSTAQK